MDAMQSIVDGKHPYLVFDHLPKGSLYPSLFVCKQWFHLLKNPEFLAKRVHTGRLFRNITEYKDKCSDKLLSEWRKIASKCTRVSLTEYLNATQCHEALRWFSPVLKELYCVDVEIDEKFVKGLPGGLETLVIHLGECTPRIDLNLLPKRVKRLVIGRFFDCESVDGLRVSEMQSLPQNLNLLVLKKPYVLKKGALKYLPKTIQQLVLDNLSDITDACLEEMLCDLKELRLENCPRITRICLRSLRTLSLEFCSGVNDKTMEVLPTTLEHVSINRCPVTDIGIESLGRLHNLTDFSLWHCNGIAGSTLNSLPTNLRHIQLGGCDKLCEEALHNLHHLSQLTLISLNFLPISGSKFSFLPEGLREIHCSGMKKFNWRYLSCLKERESLTKLNLSGEGIPSIDFNHLPPSLVRLTLEGEVDDKWTRGLSLSGCEELTNLQKLAIKVSDLTDSDLTLLPTTIRSLSFWLTNLSDKGISELTRLTSLETLDLSSTYIREKVTLPPLPAHLRQLDIHDSRAISNIDPSVVHSNLLSLTLDNSQITDGQVDDLKKKQPYLRVNVMRKRHD